MPRYQSGLICASAQPRNRGVTDILSSATVPPNRNWKPRRSPRVRGLVFLIVTSPSALMLQLERDVGRSPLWNFSLDFGVFKPAT